MLSTNKEREEQQSPLKPTSKAEERAVHRHKEVEREARWMMIEWICVLSINFFTHFMRMSIVMLYCVNRFGASELSVGLMVSIHMLIMGVANTYVCNAIDDCSFESLMIVRFSLLTLATIGEYLADSFVLFASIYCAASLAVVWFGVQAAYCVKVLPPVQAKSMTNVGLLTNRIGVITGLSFGGLIGGFVSIRAVFLLSVAVSFGSLMWILLVLRGKEQRMKNTQSTEIAQMYRDFPHLFSDHGSRFPIESTMELTRRNDSTSSFCDDYLFSVDAIPFWSLCIRNGVTTAAMTELSPWYVVYAHQVFNADLQQSSMQLVTSIIVGILVSMFTLKVLKPQRMQFDWLLNVGVSSTVLTSVLTALLFLLVFPALRFSDFWLGLMLVQGFVGLTFPFPNTLQVAESPAQSAGKMFAVLTASRSIISAIQHVIIGRLWSVGGANHPWFFRWFGILHLSSAVLFLVYFVLRKGVDIHRRSKETYQEIPDE